MSVMLIISSTLITFALIFYSIGIWSERIARFLKPWHILFFWSGMIFDISGTYAMHLLSKGAFNIFEPHTFTGQIALWLMFSHAIWATYVVFKGSDRLRIDFHKYSIIVWCIWLIPYFSGMYLGMSK